MYVKSLLHSELLLANQPKRVDVNCIVTYLFAYVQRIMKVNWASIGHTADKQASLMI